jgi:hypothetical protein
MQAAFCRGPLRTGTKEPHSHNAVLGTQKGGVKQALNGTIGYIDKGWFSTTGFTSSTLNSRATKYHLLCARFSA